MKHGSTRTTHRRIPELDFLRGFAIVLMVFHHTIMDLRYTFDLDVCAFQDDFWFIGLGRPIVLALFLLVSGMSSVFSRSNLKRGVRMLLFGLAETAVTAAIDRWLAPTGIIFFNVIHVIACSVLLFVLFMFLTGKWTDKKKTALLVFAGAAVIFAAQIFAPVLPEYSGDPFLSIFGFPLTGRSVMDNMSLLPWMGFFFIGAAAGRMLFPGKGNVSRVDDVSDGSYMGAVDTRSDRLTIGGGESDDRIQADARADHREGHDRFSEETVSAGRRRALAFMRPFAFVGHHALLIYIFHQPVILGVCALMLHRSPIA